MNLRSFFLTCALLTSTALAQTPEWVWTEGQPAAGEVRYFRKTFNLDAPAQKAELKVSADDEVVIYVNGKEVGRSTSWKKPVLTNIAKELRAGENVIACDAKNVGGSAAFIASLTIDGEGGKKQTILSDTTWTVSPTAGAGWNNTGFAATDWKQVKRLAKLGDGPWGDIFTDAFTATPAEKVTVAPGFKVELLKSATKDDGSWVSMAIDDKGRLYISSQGNVPGGSFKKDSKWAGLVRVTLDAKGQIAKWEQVPLPIGDSMGMLWAFNSLYVSGNGPEGRGIYRLKDTDGDDVLDSAPLWKAVPGGNGEHGAHALVLGPDGKSIYIAHGNSTPLVDKIDQESAFKNYAEDILLPRIMDPVATFFDKLKSPYGYVLRTDENGATWDLMAGGFRNQYDIDFNAEGELFTYDSDMEWDVGLPWYRPTRVLHIIPGGEYGFREGNQKMPEYFADTLPASVDIGLGCPTGVKFGTKSNFPLKYRRAFYIMDWTFGRLLAVHLTPKGASYTAKNPLKNYNHPVGPESSDEVEVFLTGKGMPLTDLEFGQDGAMYFTIGGRGTQAGLYRVSYVGDNKPAAPDAKMAAEELLREDAAAARGAIARMKDHAGSRYAVDEAWPLLASKDRFTSFPARTLLENMSIGMWKDKALAESDPRTALNALLALARVGSPETQKELFKALSKFAPENLDEELQLLQLRVLKVSLIRQGRPDTDVVSRIAERLNAYYPAKSFALNHELSELLVWLGSPEVVEKTLTLLGSTEDKAEQIWYACMLREAQGWTAAQKEKYFTWFAKARTFKGGNSFGKFILRMRDQALEKLPAEERPALLALAEKAFEQPKPAAPAAARAFVKAWTLEELLPIVGEADKGRNFERGKALYAAAMCSQCHLYAGEGGTVGPDLTAVGGRFSRKDILEAIIDPSKALSEQYASFLFTMKDGSMFGGQVAEENHYLVTLVIDPINGTRQNIPKGNIVKREMSPVSLMPPGLLSTLNKEEILDLLAYLESAGNPKAPAFQK